MKTTLSNKRQCLTKFQNTSNFGKNTSVRVVFLTLLSVPVFGNVHGQTRSFVSDDITSMLDIHSADVHWNLRLLRSPIAS